MRICIYLYTLDGNHLDIVEMKSDVESNKTQQNPMSMQKVNGNIMIQNTFLALVTPVYCNESADSQFTVNALSFREMHCKKLQYARR